MCSHSAPLSDSHSNRGPDVKMQDPNERERDEVLHNAEDRVTGRTRSSRDDDHGLSFRAQQHDVVGGDSALPDL